MKTKLPSVPLTAGEEVLNAFLARDADRPFFSFGRKIASMESFYHSLKFWPESKDQRDVMASPDVVKYRMMPFPERQYLFAGYKFVPGTLEHYLLLKTIMRSKLSQYPGELKMLVASKKDITLTGWSEPAFHVAPMELIIQELREEFQAHYEETGSLKFTTASEHSQMPYKQFLFGESFGVRPDHE